VVGLDVGTTKIWALIGEPKPGGSLDIIGVGNAPSRGLRRGVVVNIDSTVEAIKQAVAEAEQMAGVDVSGVYAGIAGGHVRSLNSRGVVAVSGREREVSALDVERAVDAARAINVPQDREIIHVLPQTFMVDDADGPRELSRQVLSEIIQPRLEEIFTLVAQGLVKAGFTEAATAGIVVTGGSSILEGVPELAEAVFELPVRRGVPVEVGGLAEVVRSPIYATGVGLALYGARRQASGVAPRDANDGAMLTRLGRRLAGWFGEL